MKLAIIRQRYNPFGGAERFVERALGALADEGTEVTLITRSWKGAAQNGYRQIICDPPYSRLLGGRAARDKSFAMAVQAIMATENFDIIQSHERIPGCTIFRAGDGVHAAWLSHRSRTLGPFARLAQRFSPFHRNILRAEHEMFRHANLEAVICNSQMVADEINRFYHVPTDKLHVIYNGIDTQHFHPRLREEHRSAVRSSLKIADSAPLLLYVGSGFARKGVQTALQAMAACQNKAIHFAIVGQDKHAQRFKALSESLGLSSRVHFVGPVPDTRPWYGAADGFVLPTLYDPCPNAVLEAMSSGLPCITTYTCGAREWIEAGKNGWLVDPLDIPGLAACLDLLANLEGGESFREAARAAVEPLTLEAMATRLLALYALLRGPGKAKL